MNYKLYRPYSLLKFLSISLLTLAFLCLPQSQTQAQCVPAASGVTVNYTINQPSCNGDPTGSVAITVNGGGDPYTFTILGSTISFQSITQAGNTFTFTNLPADPSFFITVQSKIAVGFAVCNFSGLVLTEPDPISITNTITDASCNLASDGAIDLNSITGGTAPYTFLWSTGATTQNISGITTGSYSVTITDDNGCQESFNFTVAEPPPITITSNINDVTCNNGSNGNITLTSVAGGTGPYTFLWSTGAITQNISGLTTGSYSVTVTDDNGCQEVFNFNITEPTPIAITSTLVDATCNGASNGSITLNSVSGGNGPYTFLWSTGATTQNVSGLATGPYSVTVTDDNGCEQVFNFNIDEPTPIAITSTLVDATCNGASNGSITLNTISGGTGPYTFLWSTGATTQNISGLATGAYSVTVTDDNGCDQIFNFNINEPATITMTSTVVDATCNGASNGSITLNTISGGTGPYSFLWSTGATTQNISGLATGAYSVTVTDDNGCDQIFNFNIDEPATISITSNTTNVSCNSGSDGTITLTSISGGTAPYTFLWNTGATTQNVSGLGAGSPAVTITDANGCNQVFNFNITEPVPILITSTIVDATCNGTSTGSITLNTVSGGNGGAYTFLWNTGATTQNLSGVTAGLYSVTVTDVLGCPIVFNFTIDEPTPIAITSTLVDATCNGASNGSITLNTISGGTGPYTFLWSTGATTQNISGLATGAYSVTVTDDNGCDQIFNFNINEPATITMTSTVVDATCNGASNGSITLNTISGGTGPYSFLWSTGATTQNISGLATGAYSVTVTDDNGCDQIFNFNIDEPATISITSNTTNVSCNSGSDGTITLTSISGGTAPYTFLWNTGATTQNVSGLGAGSPAVTITDANGCNQVFNFNITEPVPILITSTIVDATCNGTSTGSITLNTVSGGNGGAYIFLWNTGATTQNVSGLAAGPYSVTVTDVLGCPIVFNFTIDEPTPITITSTVVNSSTCGGNDGTITLSSVSGGTGPYTFLWSTGAITQNISGLTTGSYSVTVTDDNGCQEIFNFSISDPTPFTVTSAVTDVTCNGANNGSITHTIVGGTAPFSILWDTGAITQDLTGISGGTYTVTITDASNCTYNGNYTVNEPAPIAITSTTSDITTCGGSDGSITLSVSGGITPYTFLWSTGASTQNISGLTSGAYSVTITDDNGCNQVFNFGLSDPTTFTVIPVVTDVTCNGAHDGSITHTITGGTAPFTFLWNTGAVSQDLTGLNGGSYTITITDASNCSYNGNYTINEPASITMTSNISDISTCGGTDGSITLTSINGGTLPYSFLWNTGATTQNIASLTAGSYSVVITDANGCNSTPFNFNLADPVTFTVTEMITDVTCNGGSNGAIDLSIVGGALPFSFLWSNGATTEDINTLIAGSYNVTVTDGGGCTFSGNYTVNEPTAMVIASLFTNVTCNAGIDGSITLTSITGGNSPYTFLWSTGASTQNISGLAAGAYAVTITDASGCPQTLNVNLTEPVAMTNNSSITNVTTCGGSDGSITISAIIGGNPSYTFLWNTGAVTQNISGLAAGVYSVNVTDANSCSQVFNYTLSEPVTFTVTPTIVDVLCNGSNTGSISLSITGGTGPFTFLWNTGATTSSISNLIAGNYTVNVTDASGCSSINAYTISEPNALTIVSTTTNTGSCSVNDGDITINSITGGIAPYTFFWNTGAVTQNISGLSSGTYAVTITDANLCPQSFTFAISNPTPFTVVPDITNILCNNTGGGAISLAITGGTAPITILWNTGSGSNSITNLAAGTYTVTVTDASTCSFNGSYTLTEPSAVDTLSILTTLTHVICPGSNEGSVLLSNITGGTPSYTYSLDGISSNTPSYTTLTAGTYTMTIQDANGCNFYHSFVITEPNPIAYTVSTTLALCTDDNGELSFDPVTGGTPPYEYSIDGGISYSSQTIYHNLPAATYSVFVRDANLCTYGYLVPVNRKPGPIPYVRTDTTTCFGGNDGAIILDSIQGGISPFNFFLNGLNRGSSRVYTNLTSGTYNLRIQDTDCTYDVLIYYLWNGIDYDTIYTGDINVLQPAKVTADINGIDTDRQSSSGVAFLNNFRGGTAPYQYSLDTIAGYKPVINDNVLLAGLSKGSYTVFLADTNGCKGEISVKINIGFFIPNLITPNGDGRNDYFEIMALPLGSKLQIYNSWNERVYYNENYDNSWDATGLSNSVYYYELSLPDGQSYKGWIQTLR